MTEKKVTSLTGAPVPDAPTPNGFNDELHALIDRYAEHLTNAEVLGVLELVKLERYRMHIEDA